MQAGWQVDGESWSLAGLHGPDTGQHLGIRSPAGANAQQGIDAQVLVSQIWRSAGQSHTRLHCLGVGMARIGGQSLGVG